MPECQLLTTICPARKVHADPSSLHPKTGSLHPTLGSLHPVSCSAVATAQICCHGGRASVSTDSCWSPGNTIAWGAPPGRGEESGLCVGWGLQLGAGSGTRGGGDPWGFYCTRKRGCGGCGGGALPGRAWGEQTRWGSGIGVQGPDCPVYTSNLGAGEL